MVRTHGHARSKGRRSPVELSGVRMLLRNSGYTSGRHRVIAYYGKRQIRRLSLNSTLAQREARQAVGGDPEHICQPQS